MWVAPAAAAAAACRPRKVYVLHIRCAYEAEVLQHLVAAEFCSNLTGNCEFVMRLFESHGTSGEEHRVGTSCGKQHPLITVYIHRIPGPTCDTTGC